ncbi:MAG: ScyD/ScyE family protein [Caldilineaceae bacterium]|nr:ScyD/ScyE family protein [Caldilineaceae bacterium]
MILKKVKLSTILLLVAMMLISIIAPVSAQNAPDAAMDGVLADGFNAPQGILVDEDGSILVIESGLGGEEEIAIFDTQAMTDTTALLGASARVIRVLEDGTQEDVAALPSLLVGQEGIGGGRLAILDGVLYATVGQYSSDADDEGIPDFAVVTAIGEDSTATTVASTWDFERANNPDGTTLFDSHPYGITPGPDGALYVADAGANDVLRIDPETGEITVFAVLDPLPGVFPSDTRGGELLADPVPTAIVFDDEGNAYVSYLSGAPFIPGSSGVKMVAADGTVSDYATGLTMLNDLRWGPDGELYGIQFGVFTDQGPTPNSGSVVRINGGDAFDVVVEGLPFATSLDFNAEGDVFVTTNGLGAPGSGQVLVFEGIAVAEGEETEQAAAEESGAEGADATGDMAGAACDELPSHADLTAALVDVVSAADSGGFGLNMWATLVNRDGEVCAVTFSGEDRGDQWPGSRVISAQKANTANAFSLPDLALSTANLFTAVQPGGSLFGLQESNPVDTAVAYGGDATAYGQEDDPMIGQRIGGVNVFGGGLALYAEDGSLLGAVGVSGDTSCTDHIIAWKVRDALGLDYVPGGVSLTADDNIVYDQSSGWAHAECGLGEVSISEALPTDYPTGAE